MDENTLSNSNISIFSRKKYFIDRTLTNIKFMDTRIENKYPNISG